MAFDPAPTSWIPGWSEDGTNVTFPLASTTQELTAAEADAATGDSRNCIHALMDHSYQWYDGLATADRPSRLTITRSTNFVSANGVDSLRRQYVVTIDTEVTGEDVLPEPT